MEFDDASPANSYSNSQNSNNVVEDEDEEEEEEEEETSIHEVVSKGSIRYDSEFSYDDPPSKRLRVISRKVDRLSSPALESLRLIRCWGFSRVMINSSSSNLRHLEIDCECPGDEYYQSYSDDDSDENDNIDEYLEISAPKVTSFEISGYVGNRFCRLKEVSSSLVRVALRFSMKTIVGSNWDQHDNLIYETSRAKLEKCEWTLLDLLSKVSHVEKLTMGTWCTQVLSLCELRRKPEIFLKSKILEVDAFHARSLPGIARLLQKSPYLHTLIIDMNNVYNDQVQRFYEFSDFSSKNYWQSQEKSFKNALQCLKIIQLKGFDDTTSVTTVDLVMELAAFLLQNAKILEKLEYKTCDYAYHCLQHDFRLTFEFDVIKKLLSCPRSSPHARVLLL